MNIFNKFFNNKQYKNETIENSPVYEKVTVPKPEITDTAVPKVNKKNSSFEVIHTDDNGEMYRISSKNSHEIFRMNCIGHKYEFSNVNSLLKNDSLDFCAHYLKSDSRYHYIRRVFETDSGNFFYQVICSDNSLKYHIVNRLDVQKLMKISESDDNRICWTDTSHYGEWVVEPGTYESNKIRTSSELLRDHELIVSYDIVSNTRYKKIIEVL